MEDLKKNKLEKKIRPLLTTTSSRIMKKSIQILNLNKIAYLMGLMMLCTVVGLNAATINVPADQPTIQAAINAANPGDVIVLDNASSPFGSGLITIPSTKTGLTIQGNGSTISSSSASWGLTVEADNVTIDGIVMDGAGTFGIITGNPAVGGNNLTITNTSVINGGGSGFAITGVNDVIMTNITAMNNGGNGISFTSVQNVTLNGYTSSGNTFGSFSAGIGIFSCDTYAPCNADNISFTGVFNISEPVAIYTQENVCGATCGAGSITNLNIAPSNVDYTHIVGIDNDQFYYENLTDALAAADAALAADISIRPVTYVAEVSSGNKYIAPENLAVSNLSIQAAIDYSVDGDSVFVATGDMTEEGQVVVDVNITLIGEGAGTSVLHPGYNTGTGGDARGWFVVETGVEFNVHDLTLNGTGDLVYQAIRHKGSGSIDNVEFTEIKYNESGPTYQGVAVAVFGTGNVNVSNSTFTEIGRIGVIFFGTGVTNSVFENNTYTGKGDGDFLDYAVEVGAGAYAIITGNTISDNRGVASSDGSTSAGILVSTFFGPGTEALITNNIIINNTTGIAVGFDENDGSTVVANNNDIYNNTNYGVSTTNAVVDASLNWWGDASGPSGAGFGTGDSITENVIFCPWLGASFTVGGGTLGTGDVTLACNDRVHVSLDENCQAFLVADILLEGEPYPNSFFTVDAWLPNGTTIPGAILTGDHIGMIVHYKVTYTCTGSACWGTILVEDKLLPSLNCRDTVVITQCGLGTEPEVVGFPLDTPFVATRVPGENEYVVTGADPCGEAWLSYSDEVINNGCGQRFYTEITRTWVIQDLSGNTSSCTEQIGVEPGDFSSVVFPPNYDGFDQMVLECDYRGVVTKSQPVGGVNIGWNPLANGNPSPYDKIINVNDTLIGTGFPTGLECDHLVVTYTDRKIETCGENTFKLFRTWKVYDWCTGDDSTHVQSIKVVDTRAPQVICPTSSPLIVPTTPWTCTGSFIVPDPIFDPFFAGTAEVPVILRECSNYTYEIRHKVASVGTTSPDECAGVNEAETFFTTNVRQLPNGKFEVFDMPQGCNWIKYIITDECGNEVECGLEVFVQDLENPVAICDEHTVVSLNEHGLAELCAFNVDNGSEDNCTSRDSLDFSIRRMTETDAQFRDCIQFSCADVDASPLMVVFRVFDLAGNYNDCMVEVTIQDKIAPEITCPPDIEITCEEDYNDPAVTGSPTVDDQCGTPNITSQIVFEDLNDCGVGYVIKRWRVEDSGGKFDLCDQRIDIVDPTPFNGRDINWPRNYTVDGCEEIDAHPNNLPPGFDRPSYNNEDCANPVAGYDDKAFYDADGYCIKIERTWEVIDWCQYDVVTGQGGSWSYVQIIYVDNSDAPVITSSTCEDIRVCAEAGCNGLIEFELEAIDDCTPVDELQWSYEVRDLDKGIVVEQGLGNVYVDAYPRGRYRFTFKVKDACGNESTCSSIVTVEDCKEPTPYCKPGIVTTIMPSTGYVDIWASDFNDGSFDNCTDDSDLVYSFSSDVSDISRRVNCDSLNGKTVDTFAYEMWVTDLDGNQDFCRVTIIIQDNQNVCGNGNSNLVAVGGNVATEDKQMVTDVKVDLMHTKNYMMDQMTDNSGAYAFYNLNKNEEYGVIPTRNDDHLNGVSTADLVAIQRHLLGRTELASPYKVMAADVNNTKSVTAGDIAELRKLILGIYSELPDNTSWRFVDASQTFADPYDPWIDPIYESINYHVLDTNQMAANFIGIKVGDVTGDVNAGGLTNNGTRSNQTVRLYHVDESIAANTHASIDIHASETMSVEGMQLTFELSGFHVESIESEVINISSSNYYFNADLGVVTFSWNADELKEIQKDDVLLSIHGIGQLNVNASEMIHVSSSITKAEAYLENLEVANLELNARNNMEQGMALYQNIPNPFTSVTRIPFELSADAGAELTVFDVTGKILHVAHLEGKAGYNEYALNLSQLTNSGVLYYQLESNQEVATKRMLFVK